MDWIDWHFLAGQASIAAAAAAGWLILEWQLRRRSEPKPLPPLDDGTWVMTPWENCKKHPDCMAQEVHRKPSPMALKITCADPTCPQCHPSESQPSSKATEKVGEGRYGKNDS